MADNKGATKSRAAKKAKAKPPGQPKAAKKAAAVTHLFEGETADLCTLIRRNVDVVLAKASHDSISQTTPNDNLLALYIVPDEIEFLYIRLNQQLAHHPKWRAFHSNEISKTWTVGKVRDAAYEHCDVKCTHT